MVAIPKARKRLCREKTGRRNRRQATDTFAVGLRAKTLCCIRNHDDIMCCGELVYALVVRRQSKQVYGDYRSRPQTAILFFVSSILLRKLRTSRLKFLSSTSQKTGSAPQAKITSAVAVNVKLGRKTTSPAPIPSAISAIRNASVPLTQHRLQFPHRQNLRVRFRTRSLRDPL